jgi:hypothetical protein
MSVVIHMDAGDFERLFSNAYRQGPQDPAPAPDRFAYADPDTGSFPDVSQWDYAYWFGSYAEVILARAWLQANGELLQVTTDEYDSGAAVKAHGVTHHYHEPGWVIFTNYASPCMRRPTAPA